MLAAVYWAGRPPSCHAINFEHSECVIRGLSGSALSSIPFVVKLAALAITVKLTPTVIPWNTRSTSFRISSIIKI